MLHILCLVIKWIGILLAVLVALAVSALVLLLFCPVRYRAGIQKTVKEWEAQGRVSWLFGLLRVSVRGGSRGTAVEIRICGLKLSSLKKLFSRKKKKQKSLPVAADRADTAISEMQESVPADAGQAGTESGQAAKEQDGSGTDAPVAEKGQTLGERVGNGADVPLIEKAQAEGEDQTEEPVRQRQNPLKKLWDKIIGSGHGLAADLGSSAPCGAAEMGRLCGSWPGRPGGYWAGIGRSGCDVSDLRRADPGESCLG